MKYFLLTIFLHVFGSCCAQELVGNGSFEDYSDCPPGLAWITYANGWMSFQQSPDYYNNCSSSYTATVPDNWLGPQYAATGNAYAGIVTMNTTGSVFVNVREFLASQLIAPLQIGSTYKVSFKANLGINDSDGINLATNHLGARFTSTLYSDLQPLTPANFSQIDESLVITDTVNWVTVSGNFVADSNYQFIVIGNFYQDDQTDTLQFSPEPFGGEAYYFIDDVSVIKEAGDGISAASKSLNTALFPNPTSTTITLSLPSNQNTILSIFNLLGEKVKEEKVTGTQVTMDVSSLPQGVYLVRTENKIVGKFVKE